MAERFKMIVDTHLFFRKGDELLLVRRCNTGYEDGNYGLVAGHVEDGESATAAAVREAKEESGVDIDPADLVLKAVSHRHHEGDSIRLGVFFEPRRWAGELANMEPDKCDNFRWFPVDSLPPNTIPYIRQAIEAYARGEIYSEFGWK